MAGSTRRYGNRRRAAGKAARVALPPNWAICDTPQRRSPAQGRAMIHLSILIPQRDAAHEVERLLPLLERTLKGRERPYEIVCIDDSSETSSLRALDRL